MARVLASHVKLGETTGSKAHEKSAASFLIGFFFILARGIRTQPCYKEGTFKRMIKSR